MESLTCNLQKQPGPHTSPHPQLLSHNPPPPGPRSVPGRPHRQAVTAHPTDSPPQTPRAPPAATPAPAWPAVGKQGTAQGLLHLYPHLHQEAVQRAWRGPGQEGEAGPPRTLACLSEPQLPQLSQPLGIQGRVQGRCPDRWARREAAVPTAGKDTNPRPFPEPLGGSAGPSLPGRAA